MPLDPLNSSAESHNFVPTRGKEAGNNLKIIVGTVMSLIELCILTLHSLNGKTVGWTPSAEVRTSLLRLPHGIPAINDKLCF